jgi:SAM-dependent methyltransferase
VPTEQEVKDWYDGMYSEKGEGSMRPYEAYPIYLDYLDAAKGKKLLDVSCGTGFLLKAASARGLETYGIDISAEAVKIAQKISPHSKISRGKGESLEFADSTFDYVTCMGSLEHFLDKDKGLQEMRRVAKDDAGFCIGVPNSNFVFYKITGKPGTAQQDINETLMTDKEWRDLFSKNGFKVIAVKQDKWHGQKIRAFESLNPVKIAKNIFLKIAWAFLPLNWTYQFIYILKKA